MWLIEKSYNGTGLIIWDILISEKANVFLFEDTGKKHPILSCLDFVWLIEEIFDFKAT